MGTNASGFESDQTNLNQDNLVKAPEVVIDPTISKVSNVLLKHLLGNEALTEEIVKDLQTVVNFTLKEVPVVEVSAE